MKKVFLILMIVSAGLSGFGQFHEKVSVNHVLGQTAGGAKSLNATDTKQKADQEKPDALYGGSLFPVKTLRAKVPGAFVPLAVPSGSAEKSKSFSPVTANPGPFNPTAPTAISGLKKIGPNAGDNYPSLTAAIAAINTDGLGGAAILELQTGYNSSVETFPLDLDLFPGSSSINTVTIVPKVTGLSITSANATGTIKFNGGSNIIIDGRVNGTGSAKDLVIANTSTSGYAVSLAKDACNNIIQYCKVQGVNNSATSGVVYFGGTSGVTGNDNNLITSCDIRDGATTPTNLVYSAGSTNSLSVYNNNNTISNCNLFNWFNASGSNNAILILTGNTDWTISGNSFYQASSRALGTDFITSAIHIENTTLGNSFTISGNYIGGSSPVAAGTMTYTGAGVMQMILMSVAADATSGIQGNTIKNISFTTSSSSTGQAIMKLPDGAFNIGTTTGNTIGDQSSTGSIVFSCSGTAAVLSGIMAGDGTTVQGGYTISSNTIGGIAVSGAGTVNVAGIFLQSNAAPVATTAFMVSSNTIGSSTTASSISNSTANGMFGIISFAGSGYMQINCDILNNTIANLAVTSTSTGSSNWMAGIQSEGNEYGYGKYTISGNTIRNLSSASGLGGGYGNIYGINHLAFANPGQTITLNVIHTLTNSYTSSAVYIIGISFEGYHLGPNALSRNFIHSFNFAGTADRGSVMYGILAMGGTNEISNNMVRFGIDAAGASITRGVGIIGLMEQGGSNSFYFNSVYIGGSGVVAAAANNDTYGFYSLVGYDDGTNVFPAEARTIENNIFYNARTAGGTNNRHYAICVSGTGSNPEGLLSDFNLLLSNGTGARLGCFFENSVYPSYYVCTTLAAWRLATGQDCSSGSGDPLYVTPGGTSSTVNLHVQATTPVEHSGIDIPSVTIDYDGAARSSLTPVDIGADAGNFTLGTDVFPPVITYTPISDRLLANTGLSNFATITDNTGTVSGGANKPRLYFVKSTNTLTNFATAGNNNSSYNGWKYIETTSGSSPYSFTLDYSLIFGGVAAGDIIYYFVVAQDAADNLGSNWGGATASSTTNPVQNINGAPLIYYYYTILSDVPICGTFHIGTGKTYTTLTAAVHDLNIRQMSCAVTFILDDNTYPSETFPIVIKTNVGSSATNTLTIKPNTGAIPVITGNSAYGILEFYGSDYVTIDGSNSGGNDKSLTITNTYSSSGVSYTIGFFDKFGPDAATNNTIKNCIITASAQIAPNYPYCIFQNGSDGGFDNTVITNNTIRGAYGGIQLSGTAGLLTHDNQITNNIIGGTSASETITRLHILTGDVDNTLISGNEFLNPVAGSANPYQTGIYVMSTSQNTKIRKNKIHDLYYNGTTGYSAFGIMALSDASTVTEISNNVFYSIKGDGYAAASQGNNPTGIYLAEGGNYQILFNSFNITGATLSATRACYSSCISIEPGITGLDIRDNVFKNSNTSTFASAYTYGIYSSSPAAAFATMNYNDYYMNGTNPNTGYLSGNRATLANWQAITGKDINSIALDPQYNTDVLLIPLSTSPVLMAGLAIPSITTDIDGYSRLTPPDMGAYQFTLAEMTWSGTVSTDWNTYGNWNAPYRLPMPPTNVTIPMEPVNQPIVNNNGIKCHNLTIKGGAHVTVSSTKDIEVSGDLTMEGAK